MADLDLVSGAAQSAYQLHPAPAGQAHEGCIERARPDLRTLEVAQERDRPAHRFRRGAHVLRRLAVRRMVAVREIETRDVHARLHHRPQDGGRRARGPDGADDPGAADQWEYFWTRRPSSSSAAITWRSSSGALITAPPIPRTRSAECPLRVNRTRTPSTISSALAREAE